MSKCNALNHNLHAEFQGGNKILMKGLCFLFNLLKCNGFGALAVRLNVCAHSMCHRRIKFQVRPERNGIKETINL